MLLLPWSRRGTSRWTRRGLYAFSSVASSAASVTWREDEGVELETNKGVTPSCGHLDCFQMTPADMGCYLPCRHGINVSLQKESKHTPCMYVYREVCGPPSLQRHVVVPQFDSLIGPSSGC